MMRVKTKVVKDGKRFPLPVPLFQLNRLAAGRCLLHQGRRPLGSELWVVAPLFRSPRGRAALRWQWIAFPRFPGRLCSSLNLPSVFVQSSLHGLVNQAGDTQLLRSCSRYGIRGEIVRAYRRGARFHKPCVFVFYFLLPPHRGTLWKCSQALITYLLAP